MPDIKVLTVCLPKATPSDQIATIAAALLAAHGITGAGPAGHFLTTARLRTGRLVQPWNETAAGGPVGLLDLARMRTELSQQYANRWQLWNQVIAASPPARPFWHFYDRHTADPQGYTWNHGRHAFASQPRIARMMTYRPPRAPVPASAGAPRSVRGRPTGLRHLRMAASRAEPRHVDPRRSAADPPASTRRYADHLDYLSQANDRITALGTADHLVAIATK